MNLAWSAKRDSGTAYELRWRLCCSATNHGRGPRLHDAPRYRNEIFRKETERKKNYTKMKAVCGMNKKTKQKEYREDDWSTLLFLWFSLFWVFFFLDVFFLLCFLYAADPLSLGWMGHVVDNLRQQYYTRVVILSHTAKHCSINYTEAEWTVKVYGINVREEMSSKWLNFLWKSNLERAVQFLVSYCSRWMSMELERDKYLLDRVGLFNSN